MLMFRSPDFQPSWIRTLTSVSIVHKRRDDGEMNHRKTPLWVPMLAILVGIIGMFLFGGASEAVPTPSTQPSGIEVASTATTGHQMTAEITRVTSAGTHITSSVSASGTWAVVKLETGQSFTVDAGAYLKWASSFPFVLDSGEQIGDCTVSEGSLTCTVNTIPASVANKTDISGHWWATARVQESSVGRTVTDLTLNGKTRLLSSETPTAMACVIRTAVLSTTATSRRTTSRPAGLTPMAQRRG